MSESLELLPCPFCGAEPITERIEPHKHLITNMPDYPGAWCIECVQCEYRLFDHDSEENARKKWNRRLMAEQGEPVTEDCPLCKGKGKVLRPSFAKAGEQIEQSCHVCKGRGKLTASPPSDAQDAKDWLIWSNEHRAWWAADRCGYRANVADAGRYSRKEAISICRVRSWDGQMPPETMIHEQSLPASRKGAMEKSHDR